jgi:hypothetical protein
MDKQKLKERTLKKLNPRPYLDDVNVLIISISGQEVLIDKEYLSNIAEIGSWRLKHSPEKIYFVHTTNYPTVQVITLHRFIMNIPKEMEVDHINGDTLDNRKVNLRVCTKSENNCNRKINQNNTSGYKGVSYKMSRHKWCAKIGVNNKNIHLGYFDSPEEAYAAYCIASKKYHGEFGRIV